MQLRPLIRKEKETDIGAISEITVAAFQNHPYSKQTEQFIISSLRAARALTLSLVTIAGRNCDWHGIGPVSVLPDYQRQGIGKSLVQERLSLLKKSCAKGCVLVGDPGYYVRFGFRNIPGLILDGVPQEVFLALPFTADKADGIVVFHEGFGATSCS